jgi:hypothetical protein
MQFSEKALNELRRIYREEFNEDITLDEAAEMGGRIVNLVRLLSRPLPEPSSASTPPIDGTP